MTKFHGIQKYMHNTDQNILDCIYVCNKKFDFHTSTLIIPPKNDVLSRLVILIASLLLITNCFRVKFDGQFVIFCRVSFISSIFLCFSKPRMNILKKQLIVEKFQKRMPTYITKLTRNIELNTELFIVNLFLCQTAFIFFHIVARRSVDIGILGVYFHFFF